MPFDVPFDGLPTRLPPWQVSMWFEQDIERLTDVNQFKDCDSKLHAVKGEVIFTEPWVEFFDSMFDSASVASAGYESNRRFEATSREVTFYDGQHNQRVVWLRQTCLVSSGPCWIAELPSPTPGSVKVYEAASVTVPQRLALRDAIQGATVGFYGARTASAWGYFDRSAIELYSAVPHAYVQAGVSAAGYDYRGGALLDWHHEGAFSEPNQSSHVRFENRPAWLDLDTRRGGQSILYRADWATDAVQVRRRHGTEQSFCTLPSDLAVAIESFVFSGAGLEEERVVPARRVLPIFTDVGVVPGSGNLTGPTAAVLAP